MQILKLKGFLFEPSDPAIYDRDSKTVLELCGRLGYKINELIDEYNRFYEEMLENYHEAYDYMVTNLPLFVAEQLPIIAPGIMEELWGEDIEGLLQDMADFKSTFKNYEGINDLRLTGVSAPVGNYVRTLYYLTPGDQGGATYQIIDHLEEGEVANDEDIIELGYSETPTKWARLVDGDYVNSANFLSLQNAIYYAYPRNLNVHVKGYPGQIQMVEEDLIIPFSSDYEGHFIEIIGEGQRKTTIEVGGEIKMLNDASSRNFCFRNVKFQQTEGSTSSLIGFIPSGRGFDIEDTLFDNCYFSACNVDLFNFHQYTISNCKFVNSRLYISQTGEVLIKDCNFIYDSEYQGVGIHLYQCGYINILNCKLHSEYISPLFIEGSNNINCENIYYNAVNSAGLGMERCSNCKFENVEVVGAISNICALGGFNNNHIAYKNFYNYATLYTPGSLNCGIWQESGGASTFENIGSTTTTLIYLMQSGNNVIYSYNNPNSHNIFGGTGASNFVYLDNESDISYIPSGASFEVRNEVKFGDTSTMNSLTGYNGRVYYNTETSKVMLYNEYGVWQEMGEITQFVTMPTASIDNLGKVYQYVGTTDSTYTKGHFYESVVDGSSNYSWQEISFGGGSGSADIPYYYHKALNSNTNFQFNSGSPMCQIKGDDQAYFTQIVKDCYDKGIDRFLLLFRGYYSGEELLLVRIMFNNPGSLPDRLDFINVITTSNFDNLTYRDTQNGKARTQGRLEVTQSNGEISSYAQYGTFIESSSTYLGVNNTSPYTPTRDYHPATKLYVDSNTTLKYTTMPTADSSNEGTIVQYVGATDSTYTKGYFYECVSDGASTPTYSWQEVMFAGSQPIVDLLSTLRSDVGNIITLSTAGDSYFKKSGNMYTLMVCIELTQALSPSSTDCLLAIPLAYNPSSVNAIGTIVMCGTGQRRYSSGSSTLVSSFGVFGLINSLYNPLGEKEISLLANDLTASVGDNIYITLTWFK